MAEREEVVPVKEAIEQVGVAMTRPALLHMAFSETLVEELGEEKGKELIINSILEYGKRVRELTKEGCQEIPYYGVHEGYFYADDEYIDTRSKPRSEGEKWDFSLYKVHGCILAKIFRGYGKEDLGCLYCYVDPAKSMAADPNYKLKHTACEVCGDEYCAFDLVPTTEKERKDFINKSKNWKCVDPILVEGSGIKNS